MASLTRPSEVTSAAFTCPSSVRMAFTSTPDTPPPAAAGMLTPLPTMEKAPPAWSAEGGAQVEKGSGPEAEGVNDTSTSEASLPCALLICRGGIITHRPNQPPQKRYLRRESEGIGGGDELTPPSRHARAMRLTRL